MFFQGEVVSLKVVGRVIMLCVMAPMVFSSNKRIHEIGMGIFFVNYLPKGTIGSLISAGFIPLFNIAVGIEVAAALLTIFLALLIYKDEVIK